MSNCKQTALITLLMMLTSLLSWAQSGDFGLSHDRRQTTTSTLNRKDLVRRHNPQTHHVGRGQYLLGESSLHFLVDATGLQTFIADEHHSLNIGLNLPDTTGITQLDMTLDRWMGKADSHFRHQGQLFHVETVCSPAYNLNFTQYNGALATRVTSDSIFEVQLFASRPQDQLKITKLKNHAAIRVAYNTQQEQRFRWYAISWRGNASVKKRADHLVLCSKGNDVTVEGKKAKDYSLDIIVSQAEAMPSDYFFNDVHITPFTDHALRTATGWNTFWMETGLADFSAVKSPEGQQAERLLVESLYKIVADTPADWWLQAPLTAYGFARQIVTDVNRLSRRAPERLWSRPEFIAAAQLTLRGYTLPQVAERYMIKDEEVDRWREVVLNAMSSNVGKAAEALRNQDTKVPSYLNREALLSAADQWKAASDTLPGDSSIEESKAKGAMFRMPMINEMMAKTSFTDEEQSEYLLAIAARRWPDSWKVEVENILPLP